MSSDETDRTDEDMISPFIRMIVAVSLVAASLAYATSGNATTEKVALVIGIGEYAHAPRLPNPTNDAKLIASTLEEIGFSVTIELDLSKQEFDDALLTFAEKSRNASISLVYYAGHGIQVAGKVYLIPADRKVSTSRDLRSLIDAEYVLEDAALARQLSIVILDACRDSPFTRSLAEDFGPSRSAALGRGLPRIDEVPRNTLVAYATSAGDVALDGEGSNSPFALALAENLGTPGLDVRIVFGSVRDQVLELTDHQQEPFIYGSLGGQTISLAKHGAVAVVTDQPKPVPSPTPEVETVLPRVDPSPEIADLLAYSDDYASWTKVTQSGSWTDISRFRSLAPASFYSIFASRLLASRQEHPERTVTSAIGAVWNEPFDPRALPRAWITEIQRKLASASFYGGEIDGVWGPQSARALDAFAEFHSSDPTKLGTLLRLGDYADSQDVTEHLSGRWSGRYFYRQPVNGVTEVPFDMALVVSQSRIRGSIIEPNTFGDQTSVNLYASFDGKVIGNQVSWTKSYDGTGGVSHDVQYVGVIDRVRNRISGEWIIGDHKGKFNITLVQ